MQKSHCKTCIAKSRIKYSRNNSNILKATWSLCNKEYHPQIKEATNGGRYPIQSPNSVILFPHLPTSFWRYVDKLRQTVCKLDFYLHYIALFAYNQDVNTNTLTVGLESNESISSKSPNRTNCSLGKWKYNLSIASVLPWIGKTKVLQQSSNSEMYLQSKYCFTSSLHCISESSAFSKGIMTIVIIS